jgi:hypothetical protein
MLTGGIIAGQGMLAKNWAARPGAPILARFLGKFVLDIMPAALASVIGGFLFTQYQFGHAPIQRPAVEAAAPASAEMLALVRDEHAVIVDYLKSQVAAEKSRQTAEIAARDADATADAEGGAAASAAPRVAADVSTRRIAAATVTSRPATARAKAAAAAPAAPVHAPLVIAQAEPMTAPAAAGLQAEPDDRDANSLLGKTLDLKDHVVAATRHVVFAIGDVFASMGQRLGDLVPARQFSSAS